MSVSFWRPLGKGLSWPLPASGGCRYSLTHGFMAQRVSHAILDISSHSPPSVHVCICVQRIPVVLDCMPLRWPHHHLITSAKTFYLSHVRHCGSRISTYLCGECNSAHQRVCRPPRITWHSTGSAILWKFANVSTKWANLMHPGRGL